MGQWNAWTIAIGVENSRRLRELVTARFGLMMAAVLFMAYIAEIGSPTFSNDYFYDINISPIRYAFVYDGRYFSEILRHLFDGVYPPSFILILALICLVCCGLAICLLLGITDGAVAVLVCSLMATNPMLFETLSYPSIRFFVPLAALLSVLAMLTPSTVLGVMLIFLALNLYQSAIYLAVVVTIYVAAVQLITVPVGRVFRTVIWPCAARVMAGIVLYVLVIQYFQFGSNASRLTSFTKMASSTDDVMRTVHLLLKATVELYTKDLFLFPSLAKYVFAAITVALLFGMAIRRNFLSLILVLLAPLAIFGAAWVMYPATHMLSDRILFTFAGVYAATVATTWLTLPRLRPAVVTAGWLIVAVFVYQANVWHQFMDLRNRADIDLARSIADRVKALPEFQRGMPLVVVGNIQDRNYLPYRVFDTTRGLVRNSMLPSMYSQEWSSDRALLFFLDFKPTDADKRSIATDNAATMPAWPAEGSVAVKQDVIVVRLN